MVAMAVTDEDHPVAGRRRGEPSGEGTGDGSAPGRRGPLRLVRDVAGARRRPAWWVELLFIGGSYFLYTLTRNSVPAHQLMALHRARDVLDAEQWLHIDMEHAANVALTHAHWLAVGANYYYATMHFAVTIGVLLWLYLRHPQRYRGVRTALYVTNLVALLGFWLYPLAPPRMLPGFVDTIIAYHTWGSWGSGDVAQVSNQFAAMPSLHIGWSLWCGLTIWRFARRRWVRVLGLCHPLLTFGVIVGTANHFVLDAVGGVAALATGFAVQRLVSGRPAYDLRAPAAVSGAA